MKLPRLLQTTAVRLALKYVLAYGLVVGLALGALLWTTSRYVDPGLEDELEEEFASLQEGFAQGGRSLLLEHLETPLEGDGPRRVYLLVAGSGEKLGGEMFEWPEESDLETDGNVQNAWIDDDVFPAGTYEEDVYLPVIAGVLPDGSRLLLTRGLEQDAEVVEITEYLIEVLSAAVVLSLLMGIMLGRAILGRMDEIGRTASEIMAGELSHRVPVSGRQDEFDLLAGRLNAMLDRIQQLIRGIREVTDNIAHDLRSPLTRLRNKLEVTLLESRTEAEYQEAIRHGIEEAESLIRTFNALLGIAQAEAGNHRSEWAPVDLCALSRDLAELYQPVAEEKGQTLDIPECETVRVPGSRDLLAQALGNLLENAVKYTPEGGTVRLQLARAGPGVEVSVSDTGPGIPESEREHVLERFVRLEGSRHTPGNGLGLSLVRAVAKLHKADLELGDARPGLRVTLRFPAVAAA